MAVVGDVDFLGLGQLRLDRNPQVPMPWQDYRLCLRGRLAGGGGAKKVVLVATNRAVAVLGGLTWYDMLKPEAHALDMEFNGSSVAALEVGFQSPDLIEAEMHIKPTRFRLARQRVPSISFAVRQGRMGETKEFTFVPDGLVDMRPAARVFAELVNDDLDFVSAAKSVFSSTSGVGFKIEGLFDCRLIGGGGAELVPSRLVLGSGELAILRSEYLRPAGRGLLQRAVRSLADLTGCLVCFPADKAYLARGLDSLPNIQVDVSDRIDEILIRLAFGESIDWITPGVRGEDPEVSMANIWDLLIAFERGLST